MSTFRSIALFPSDESARESPVKRLFEDAGFDTGEYAKAEPSFRRPMNFLNASRSIAREIKRRGIHLVHCSETLAAHYSAFGGRLAGVPVLCHVRNRIEEISFRDQTFLRPVSHWAFVSKDTWDHFPYRVRAERGTVLYDGIELAPLCSNDERHQYRTEWKIPKEATVIGMIARVAPQKDYETLIRAAAEVVKAEPNVRFMIVGDHNQADAHREHYNLIRKDIVGLELERYFIFTGFQANVTKFLDLMDIFVLSTNAEGLPLVIIEAMARNKPVVATAVDGVPEIVIQGETGFLVPHNDHLSLASRLLTLIQDPIVANQFGEAGFRAAQTKWSSGRFAKDLNELYLRVLKSEQTNVESGANLGSGPMVTRQQDTP
ncbi:MAG: glycosyltransferase [Blastocatellia bacterium]|nr:glycosyltransferase [Blastocatellia bacterium]